LDINKLKKSDILWLVNHRCSHHHDYLSHIKCAERDNVPFVSDKVLLFDLETSYNLGAFWGKSWETDIVSITEYGKILCFAGKWLDGKMMFYGWNEKRLLRELWKLFDEADVVVAHNGKQFDVKWATTKFIQYGLPHPSKYKVFDTLKEAKKQLYLPSYKLNDISDYFGLGQKVEHEGLSLWKKCIKGDKKARKKMELYNIRDVALLEKLYYKLV